MEIRKYNAMLRHLTRPSDKITKASADKLADKLGIKKEDRLSNGSTKTKPMPIMKYISAMNRMYGNGKVDEYGNEETARDRIQDQERKKKIPVQVSGIKDSSLYKLLENPKVLGMELGHDTIMQVIEILKNSGVVKKPKKEKDFKFADILPLPKKESKKIVAAVEDPIDHIAIIEKNFS